MPEDTAYWMHGLDMQNIYIDGLIVMREKSGCMEFKAALNESGV